jgi:hypothetical protein
LLALVFLAQNEEVSLILRSKVCIKLHNLMKEES